MNLPLIFSVISMMIGSLCSLRAPSLQLQQRTSSAARGFKLGSLRSLWNSSLQPGSSSGFIPVPDILSSSKVDLFRPVLVSIEGNIGAGKTTLLKKLREAHPEWISIDEPVDTWSTIRNEAGESILEIFYKDRRRWSYTFQNCALLTRYQNIESSISSKRAIHRSGTFVFLTERCLETDYHVFTRMLKDEGSIDNLEIELYERLLSQLKKTATDLSAIIHVNTEPEVCKDRIKQRGRSGEDAITLDYLNALHKYQSKWIESTHLPTLQADVSNFHDVEEFIKGLMN